MLGLAAVAKLRRPGPAALALAALGIAPGRPALRTLAVRGLAAGEIGLGALCLLWPSTAAAGALGGLYGTFALVILALASRRVSCGCFGEGEAPASWLQSLLNAALSLLAFAAAAVGAHSVTWLFGTSPIQAAISSLGLGGAVYAAMLAYRDLPRLWSAWSVG